MQAASLRIVGGEGARVLPGPAHPYPFYAQIFAAAPGAASWSFVCGGAVVAAAGEAAGPERDPGQSGSPPPPAALWVLTAAHCLDPSREYAVNVHWLPSRLPPTGAEIPAPLSLPRGSAALARARNAPHMRLLGEGITIFPHPHHGPGAHPLLELLGLVPAQPPRDIALLRVALPPGEALPSWTRTSLPALGGERAAKGAPAYRIIGHGQTGQGPESLAPTLQQLDVAAAPAPGSLLNRHLYADTLPVSAAAAAAVSAPAGACFGDSGGPLLASAADADADAAGSSGLLAAPRPSPFGARDSLRSPLGGPNFRPRGGGDPAGIRLGEAAGAEGGRWAVLGALCCSLSPTCGDRAAPDLYAPLARYLGPASPGARELRDSHPATWGLGLEEMMRRNAPPPWDPAASPQNVWADIPRAPLRTSRIAAAAAGVAGAAALAAAVAAIVRRRRGRRLRHRTAEGRM